MRKRIAGQGRQGLIDQPFRTREVGRRRVGHSTEPTSRKYERQSPSGPCRVDRSSVGTRDAKAY
jgi:hypothetical protein